MSKLYDLPQFSELPTIKFLSVCLYRFDARCIISLLISTPVAPGDVEVPEAVVVVHDVVCFALGARDSVKIRADAQTVPQTRGVAQHLDHAVLQPTTTQHQSNVVWQRARDESSVRANAPGE